MCVGLPGRRSAGGGWSFWFFLHQGKKNRTIRKSFMFFLLLVQKKEHKEKHTGNDPDSYRDSRCRTPWCSFSATVNSAKQFLSSTSTISGAFFVIDNFVRCIQFLSNYQRLQALAGNAERQVASIKNRSNEIFLIIFVTQLLPIFIQLQLHCNIFSLFTSNCYYEKVHPFIQCIISRHNNYLLWFSGRKY